MAQAPTVGEVIAWLGIKPSPADDLAVGEGLAAAVAAQAEICTVPDPLTDDLRLALLLRTARYVARRASPEMVAGFSEFGPVRIARIDADIDALEQPYRSYGTFA